MKKILDIPGLKEKFITGFRLFETNMNGASKTPVHQVRKEAMSYFEKTGFPSLKNEDWKYTNTEPLLKQEFDIVTKHVTVSQELRKEIESFFIPKLNCYRLIFVNGIFNAGLSELPENPSEIIVTNFAEALKKHTALIESHFARHADYKENGYKAINTAFAAEGVFIHLPDKTTLDKPVHFLFISDNTVEHSFIQPRNLIVAGRQSQATFIESHHAVGTNFSLTNLVSEIALDDAALINYYVVQHLDPQQNNNASLIDTTEVVLNKDSRFDIFTASLSGAFIRNSLNIKLNGNNGETHLFGLYLPEGKEFIDNHSLVDHAVPNCFSNEFYKGVMKDQSKAVFNGKIMVRPDAQKTNAYQSNKNILLSDEASIYTKPQLEIYADDVKCSHGATSGQLDEEALFYLKTRGISDATARAMLTLAFAEDVISNIKIESIREQLEKWIEERLMKQN